MKQLEISRSPKTAYIVICISLFGLVCGAVFACGWGNSSAPLPSDIVRRAWPTISSNPEDLAQAEKLRQWVEINGGCKLPCFLGINPGKTTWRNSRQILDPFAPAYSYTYVTLFDATHNVDMGMTFILAPDEDNPTSKVERIEASLTAENMGADSYYARMFETYLPASVMTFLGEPSQVWVKIRSSSGDLATLGPEPEYFLVLFYDQLGFAVQYQWKVEELIWKWKLCPDKGTIIILYIATLEKSYSIEEILLAPPYYSLEQATDMDVDTFYDTFKDASSQACLETPAKLWK